MPVVVYHLQVAKSGYESYSITLSHRESYSREIECVNHIL